MYHRRCPIRLCFCRFAAAGRLGLRTGVTHNFNPQSVGGLPLREMTLGEMFKGAGYKTVRDGTAAQGHFGVRRASPTTGSPPLRAPPQAMLGKW